jgi:hypothetical protein
VAGAGALWPFVDAPPIKYAFISQTDHETGRPRAFVRLATEEVRRMGGRSGPSPGHPPGRRRQPLTGALTVRQGAAPEEAR